MFLLFYLAFPFTEPAINPRTGKRLWNILTRVVGRSHEIGGKAWKERAGYHKRSLEQTSVFRFKTIFGDHLSARLLKTQVAQAFISCAKLNRMTHLGMPKSSKVVLFGKAD